MNKGDLTKLCHLRRLMIKFMQEKVKDIFQILQKIQNLLFTVKISFLRLHFYNYTFPLQLLNGMVVHQLHIYIMNNKAEPFNLIQIFPLLQFAPVLQSDLDTCHKLFGKNFLVD